MPPRKRHLLDELRDHGAPPLQINNNATFSKSKWPGWVIPSSNDTNTAPAKDSYWTPAGDRASRRARAQRQTSPSEANKSNNRQAAAVRTKSRTSTRRQRSTATIVKVSPRGRRPVQSRSVASRSARPNATRSNPESRAAEPTAAHPSRSRTESAVAITSSKKYVASDHEDTDTESSTDDESEHSSFHPTAEDDGEWEDVEHAWAEQYDRQAGVTGMLDEEADDDDFENESERVPAKRWKSKQLKARQQNTSDPTPDIEDEVKIGPLPAIDVELVLPVFQQAMSLDGYLRHDDSPRFTLVEDAMETINEYVQNSSAIRNRRKVSPKAFAEILRRAYDDFIRFVHQSLQDIKVEDVENATQDTGALKTTDEDHEELREAMIDEAVRHVKKTGRIKTIGSIDPQRIGTFTEPIKQEHGDE